jgi:hypothetical protein
MGELRSGMTNEGVDLLWTSGWDSSFRLLQLVFDHQATVRPWYVIDEKRQSTGHEIAAMERIRDAIRRRSPAAADRIEPTRFKGLSAIREDADATARFHELRSRGALGSQYDWLSRFAAEEGIDGLELSIHRDDRAHDFVRPHVVVGGDGYRLGDDPEDPALELFRPFRFPLLDWTKPAMAKHAAAAGYGPVLELTWFCHRPWRGKPCGYCNPCRFTIDEGLGRRVPLIRRRLSKLNRVKLRVRTMVAGRLGGAR